jgi:hypothetical protein
MALAMALHARLGNDSPVAMLTEELLRMITEMTRPKRQLPDWMCCGWPVRMFKRRRAVAVLFSCRAAKRKRERGTPYWSHYILGCGIDYSFYIFIAIIIYIIFIIINKLYCFFFRQNFEILKLFLPFVSL